MDLQNGEYDDIINLPHHQSDTRPHMSLYDRAAQFAPFAALVGYDEMVDEEARLTDDKKETDENAKELLEQKFSQLLAMTEDGEHPTVSFTVFFEDKYKEGGHYEHVTGRIKKIDLTMRRILLWVNTPKAEKHNTYLRRVKPEKESASVLKENEADWRSSQGDFEKEKPVEIPADDIIDIEIIRDDPE